MKLKALMLAFAAAASLFLFTACSDSPSDVVQNFCDAMAEADFAAAKEYATGNARKEALKMSEDLEKLSDKFQEKMKEEFKKEMGERLSKLEILSEDIDGENATVKVMIDGDEETIKLKKVDGEWKILEL